MMKFMLFALLVIQTASSAPAQYTILPIGTPPVVDGNLAEWNDTYFIDSLRSDDNIFCRDNLLPWTREDFQYMVYATHDNTKIYFGLKLIADDAFQYGTIGGCSDSWKINPGGNCTSFNIFHNGTIYICGSCPYTLGSTLFATCIPTPNLPNVTAEFSLAKAVLDPFSEGKFNLCVGFEESDKPDCDKFWGGIGVECLYKDCEFGAYKNPLFYPTFTLGQVHIENRLTAKAPEMLTATPNPFTPSTTIYYNVKSGGSLRIYDMSGKEVKHFCVGGAGRVAWDASGMAAGVYLARLVSGTEVLNIRLFLIR